MAVTRAQKAYTLEVLKTNFKNAKSISFASGTRMTVAELSELRKRLRTVGATYMLEKKTLMRLALKEVHGVDLSMDMLPGQVAVLCSNSDAVAGMWKLNEFIQEKYKKDIKLEWVAAYFEGKIMGKEETIEIAAMPSRETLLARLVGSLQSPIAGLARFFDAASKKLDEEGRSNLASTEVVKKVAPKVEAPKEETVAEAPVETVVQETVETPSEEVAVETSETPTAEVAEEVAVKSTEEVSSDEIVAEVSSEETTAEEEKTA
jgi:large subunit ribosomal protein L10